MTYIIEIVFTDEQLKLIGDIKRINPLFTDTALHFLVKSAANEALKEFHKIAEDYAKNNIVKK